MIFNHFFHQVPFRIKNLLFVCVGGGVAVVIYAAEPEIGRFCCPISLTAAGFSPSWR